MLLENLQEQREVIIRWDKKQYCINFSVWICSMMIAFLLSTKYHVKDCERLYSVCGRVVKSSVCNNVNPIPPVRQYNIVWKYEEYFIKLFSVRRTWPRITIVFYTKS